MKLKTLKEIEEDFGEYFWVGGEAKDKIREEAIKWIKSFKKQTLSGRVFGKNVSAGVCYGLIQFFNIEESDLMKIWDESANLTKSQLNKVCKLGKNLRKKYGYPVMKNKEDLK